MGGNAMKTYNVARLNKSDYNTLKAALEKDFKELNDYTLDSVEVVPCYRNKDSFGDCDVLSTVPREEFEKRLSSDFVVLGRKQNGCVTSYAMKYKGLDPFQVDLIKTSAVKFYFNLCYLSYNDLGNLIGRIAAGLGYKFGHDGLYLLAWYSNKAEEKNVSRVKERGEENEHALYKKEKLVTDDFGEALELLGFNYNRFLEGFNDKKDIFEYVVTSKYFCKDFFFLDNRNHAQRTRDRKRETYSQALGYFEKREDRDRLKIKAEFKKAVSTLYPNVANLKRSMKKECKQEYIVSRRTKSARVVRIAKRYFGVELSGIALGEAMKYVKANFDRKLAYYGYENYKWNIHLKNLLSEHFNTSKRGGLNGGARA